MLFANVGVPMIAVELPIMAIALVPIVLLEAVIYVRTLRVSWNSALRGSGFANLVSTFVGIPIVWLAQVVLQLIGGAGSAWVSPHP